MTSAQWRFIADNVQVRSRRFTPAPLASFRLTRQVQKPDESRNLSNPDLSQTAIAPRLAAVLEQEVEDAMNADAVRNLTQPRFFAHAAYRHCCLRMWLD